MKQSAQSDYIFVYGSLMATVRSRVARTFHEQAEFVGAGQIQGILYDLGQYPGLILSAEEHYVQGHVFRLLNKDTLLPFLDEYEGLIPEQPELSEYRREIAQVKISDQPYHCWMYLYNQSTNDLPLIESGNYLHYLENNPTHLTFLRSLRANG
ncbi:MAG TPA: gamma-glutamylcyclotransferase family protein [Saprospiraceae bacterium]|nr:gamma-glutamylcyclotransferase family protein [Saprospiraceae bacterium]